MHVLYKKNRINQVLINPEDTVIQKKICMLGDFAIGKTSLVRRFIYNLFDDRYKSTIGVNISRKQIYITDHVILSMLIWDLSSNDVFKHNRPDYLHGTSGALLVCDLTRPDTIAKLQSYYAEKLFKLNPNASVVIIGNKIDLIKPDANSIEQVIKISNDLNAPFQITSAKTGECVEASFNILAKGLYETHR